MSFPASDSHSSSHPHSDSHSPLLFSISVFERSRNKNEVEDREDRLRDAGGSLESHDEDADADADAKRPPRSRSAVDMGTTTVTMDPRADMWPKGITAAPIAPKLPVVLSRPSRARGFRPVQVPPAIAQFLSELQVRGLKQLYQQIVLKRGTVLLENGFGEGGESDHSDVDAVIVPTTVALAAALLHKTCSAWDSDPPDPDPNRVDGDVVLFITSKGRADEYLACLRAWAGFRVGDLGLGVGATSTKSTNDVVLTTYEAMQAVVALRHSVWQQVWSLIVCDHADEYLVRYEECIRGLQGSILGVMTISSSDAAVSAVHRIVNRAKAVTAPSTLALAEEEIAIATVRPPSRSVIGESASSLSLSLSPAPEPVLAPPIAPAPAMPVRLAVEQSPSKRKTLGMRMRRRLPGSGVGSGSGSTKKSPKAKRRRFGSREGESRSVSF